MEEKISIIVPIYKVEKYLKKCIESIINQSYKNLEIILVDDGSPDNCGTICDDYAKRDSRIMVIHKKNGGLSDARNVGTEYATGDYICYIDSDDYVSVDYVEYLLRLIKDNGADVSIVMPNRFNDGDEPKNNYVKEKIINLNSVDAIVKMLYQKDFGNAAHCKMYSKKVIRNITYPVGKLYEDIGTTYKYFLNSKKITYSNLRKYYYLQRKDSIMSSDFKEQDMDYIYQSENLMNDVKIINNYQLNKAAICRYVNANFSILLKIRKRKEFAKYRKEIESNINRYRLRVFFDKRSRLKTKIAILLYTIKLI